MIDGPFIHSTGHPEMRAVIVIIIMIITTHTYCYKHRSCQFPSCHTPSSSVLVDYFHQTIRFLLTLLITNRNCIHCFAGVVLAHYSCFVWSFYESFVQTEDSLQYLQEFATGPYPEAGVFILWASGLWHSVVWEAVINASEEYIMSIFSRICLIYG
jgi:hypothetical protein